MIDLTVREGDEDEERAQILECQTKLRAFASVAGLNARGTPKREAKSARVEFKRQDVAEHRQKRKRKKIQPRQVERDVVVAEEEAADEDEKDETRERPKRGREKAKEELENQEEEEEEEEEKEKEKEEEEEKQKEEAQQSVEKHGNSEKAGSDEDEEAGAFEKDVEWKVELRDELEFAQWSVADVLDLLANREAESMP